MSFWLVFQDAVFDENNEKTFYDSDSEEKKGQNEAKPYMMDPDHRLLLRNTKPLLQSRNTAVRTPLFVDDTIGVFGKNICFDGVAPVFHLRKKAKLG